MPQSTFDKIRALVAAGDVFFTVHARDELDADRIPLTEVPGSVETGVVVENYATHPRGPCVLVGQTLSDGSFVHIVWDIRLGRDGPAAVITGYRPAADKWSNDFTQRDA